MDNAGMLQAAIEAIEQGKFERARDILTRLLRQDQNNPNYWLWMSAAVQNRNDKKYCLENVLRFDPENSLAKQGLALLEFSPQSREVNIKPFKALQWTPELRLSPELKNQKSNYRTVRWVFGLIILISVVGGLFLLQYFINSSKTQTHAASIVSKTPLQIFTYTPSPTMIGAIPQSTPSGDKAEVQPTPLWAFLEATYTPTPIYINTPHPISEAYRAAMVAFGQSKWESAAGFFEQALRVEPTAADIFYYYGESLRNAGKLTQALDAYRSALQINPNFAAAYLGLARGMFSQGNEKEGLNNLNRAIQLDSHLVEAYLERANYDLAHNKWADAAADQQALEDLIPNSALLHLLKAKLALHNQDDKTALEEARLANSLDRTLLESYLVYGQAALVNGDFKIARDNLQIYLQYANKDGYAWYLFGRAIMKLANERELAHAWLVGLPKGLEIDKAMLAFQKADSNSCNKEDLFLYQSALYLEKLDGQNAVNDFIKVRSYAQGLSKQEENNDFWFAYNVGLGKAFFYAARNADALAQFNQAETLAKTPQQHAVVFFWRATIYEKDGKAYLANRDWLQLLKLPPGDIPEEFSQTIIEKRAMLTPSPTLKIGVTATPTP
ncbi:MAG: tetratricopeptide repeat protein [Anaerolineales bacterium]